MALTKRAHFLIVSSLITFFLYILLQSTAVLLLSLLVLTYIVCALIYAHKSLTLSNFTVKSPKEIKVIAGKTYELSIHISSRRPTYSVFHVGKPLIKVSPTKALLTYKGNDIRVILRTNLSGPSVIKLSALVYDNRFLLMREIKFCEIKLNVIPRAKVALWLVSKAISRGFEGPLGYGTSEKPSRVGIEYLTSREFMPGDIPRFIDWKKTLKFHEVYVKEFSDIRESPIILVINLITSNIEEADKLAYLFLTTALTLALRGFALGILAYKGNELVSFYEPAKGKEALLNSIKVIGLIRVSNESFIINPNAFMFDELKRVLNSLMEIKKTSLIMFYKKSPLRVLEKFSNLSIILLTDENTLNQAVIYHINTLRKLGFNTELLTTKRIT